MTSQVAKISRAQIEICVQAQKMFYLLPAIIYESFYQENMTPLAIVNKNWIKV